MKNNKGFTLMELTAAIFIGGMVTAALVLVWKTASTQTSQGQRQTIIRNQVSNFQRQLYRDFYSADIITFPEVNTTDTPDLILAGLKKAKRISSTQFQVLRYAPQGPTIFFAYCLAYVGQTTVIKRLEQEVPYSVEDPTDNISDYMSGQLDNCRNDGRVILSNFTRTLADITPEGNYILKGSVTRTFDDAANTTPVYIEINETLAMKGGI